MNRLAFVFCLFWLSSPALAVEEEPFISIKAEVNKAFVTIASEVEYTVTVRHDPRIRILSSIRTPATDILKVKKVADIQRREGDLQVTGRKFTLAAYRLGQFILEPIQIQYRVDKGEVQTLETERIFLTVKSVAEGEEKQDIRGLKDILDLAFRYRGLLLFLLILAIAAGSFFFWRSRKRLALEGASQEPVLSAEDHALRDLARLFESDLLPRNKVKEYYLQFSEILRTYLERRYAILAVESTTSEIHRSLKEIGLAQALRERIHQVLEAADLAKFAKWKPEPAEVVRLNKAAQQIVEDARPQTVVQEPGHGV